MTRGYAIFDATPAHAIDLRGRLRALDLRECIGMDGSARRSLHRGLRRSLYAKAAILDGHTIAMWGLGGAMVGDEGHPWFLTAPEVERFPVAMVREARRAVVEMLELRPILWNYVLADYARAVKYVSLVGFSLSQPTHVAPNGDIYRKFWMKR